MKRLFKILFLCICFCGMTQFVGCMQQKEAPENLSYAAEQIPVTYKAETELLKKYKDLLDTGVITQEEFDAKKKQILGL